MRRVRHEIRFESLEERLKARRENPCLVVCYRDSTGYHEVPISAGSQDDVSVFREKDTTFVLTTNSGVGYLGLEAYCGDAKLGDVFFHQDIEVEQVLGRRGFELSETTMAKRLAEYIQD